MVRIAGTACGRWLPAGTAICIRGTPSAGGASLGDVVRQHDGGQGFGQGRLGRVLACLRQGLLARSLHARHRTCGPGMRGGGPPRGHGGFLPPAGPAAGEDRSSLLPRGHREARGGAPGVQCVRPGRPARAPTLGRHRLEGRRVTRGLCACRRALHGVNPGELAFVGMHLGPSAVDVAARRWRARRLLWHGARASRHAAAGVARATTVA
jgi:hypothetical protein